MIVRDANHRNFKYIITVVKFTIGTFTELKIKLFKEEVNQILQVMEDTGLGLLTNPVYLLLAIKGAQLDLEAI